MENRDILEKFAKGILRRESLKDIFVYDGSKWHSFSTVNRFVSFLYKRDLWVGYKSYFTFLVPMKLEVIDNVAQTKVFGVGKVFLVKAVEYEKVPTMQIVMDSILDTENFDNYNTSDDSVIYLSIDNFDKYYINIDVASEHDNDTVAAMKFVKKVLG